MSIIERINFFIKHKNFSVRQFALEISVAPSVLNRYLNGLGDTSITLVSKILDTYPELNAEWLMREKGVMLKSNPNLPELPELLIPSTDYMKVLEKLNETQQKLIECMEKKVEPNKVVPGSIPPSYKRT